MTGSGHVGRYSSAQPCSLFRDGVVCGRTPTRPFIVGPRCDADAPPQPFRDPATSLDGLRARMRQRSAIARPVRYFDGSPGRELVKCPDCGDPAAAVLGSHLDPSCARRKDAFGRVRTDREPGQYQLACMTIQAVALERPVFSANHTRAAMDAKHIPVGVRTRAFKDLAGEVMVAIGYEPSTEPARGAGPRRDVRTYRSLIHLTDPAAAVDQGDQVALVVEGVAV